MVHQTTCKHVDSLRASLESLMHTPLNANSAAKIRTDLANIQSQLAALKGHGGSAFSSEMNKISASVDKVQKAASGLSNPPTYAQVTAVVTALSELKSQSKSSLSAMHQECPKH